MAKRIGILGGLSPESTASYYLRICRKFTELTGSVAFPEIVVYSLCLENYDRWRSIDRWDLIVEDLSRALRCLEACDVELAALATNTIHKVFDEVSARTRVEMVSIVDATAERILGDGLSCVGLLGTGFTMTDGFYARRLADFGISTIVPPPEDMARIDEVIDGELVKGVIREDSRVSFLSVIDGLVARGAAGVVLGCTEIPLLVRQEDLAWRIYDTASIHADRILERAMS